MDDTDRMAAYLGNTKRHVAERGWMVQGVGAGPETAQFAYTAGLTAHDHPELLIIALRLEVCGGVLEHLAEQVYDGVRFYPGQRLAGVLNGGYEIELVAATDLESHPPSVAKVLYGTERLRVLQLVFPDMEHRFPWDEGCEPAMVKLQPVLGPRNA